MRLRQNLSLLLESSFAKIAEWILAERAVVDFQPPIKEEHHGSHPRTGVVARLVVGFMRVYGFQSFSVAWIDGGDLAGSMEVPPHLNYKEF